MQRPDEELAVASLVDNMYRVVRLIGRGGMGAVYEAEDIRLGRPVALKVLRSDLARQLQADERFLQEARVLARIRSPFVATVYSIGATDTGKTYIAMEYIDGESLGDVLDRERWLPLARAVRITQRVAEALVEAHDLGIIHRDLKPDNILLTRIGSVDDYVKVVDLGLAKHIESAGSSNNPRLTQARLVLGTPAYMSPEQAAGHDVGPVSDLYSLGVILYEMATGFLPVDGETPQDFLRAHQLQPPVSLAQRRADLRFPPQAEAFVQRVLSKDADDRPTDAREFLEELSKLEGVDAARAQQPSTAQADRRPRARHASTVGPTLDILEDRLERAKERVRVELMGVVSRAPGMLYEALDTFTTLVSSRADMPVVVRVRVPPPEGRVPLACLFEEVRVRAGVFDDDPPSMARRKLLRWVQGLMPDRPGRASQVAHLVGLFLNVDFPDSPHLSHARAVPEVARMAGGAALADVLRAIAGRGSLVLLLEHVENLTDSECDFLRRLVRQLGTMPVLVVTGWLSRNDEVPEGLSGMVSAGSIARIPSRDNNLSRKLEDPALRSVIQAAARIGSPVWPDLIEAALGYSTEQELARLVAMGALRPLAASRLSNQVEYLLGDIPEAILESGSDGTVDLTRALGWLHARAVERPRVWSARLAPVEAAAGDLGMAATHAREAAEAMRSIGALTEAIEAYEQAAGFCRRLAATGEVTEATLSLAEAALGQVACLRALGDDEQASMAAREAVERLRELPGLREQNWCKLGLPLLVEWASAEARLGRADGAVAPLGQQIEAISRTRLPIAQEQLPSLRRALGDVHHSLGDVHRALEEWLAASRDLPLLPHPALSADLSMRIAGAYRETGEGERAVAHARKALAAARDARDLVREAEALRTLALALCDIGEMDDAEAQLGEALNALGRVDRQRLSAEVSVLLALVLMARGAHEEADAALAKACRAFAALTDLEGLADALRKRGEIQMAQGIYTRAQAFAEESSRQAILAGNVPLQVKALLLSARASAAAGDTNLAHRALESAFQLVAPGVPTVERGDCMVALADLLEAGVLTSDRDIGSLLLEAMEVYRGATATEEAEQLQRRLRAMGRLSSASS